jgi:NitT/TauT family transport system ATP-binding protein
MPADTGKEVLISIRGLTKRFGGKTPVTALKDVSLDINKGEFVSIVGPSGCGKTTLLRIIAGLEQKTQGEILFHDGANQDIGFVFQDPNLMPWRTAVENAALVLELQGMERGARTRKAMDVLRVSGLQGYEAFYPRDLSGGMRHRVAIARSLVHEPSVLVMDEPFAALDVLTRSEMSLELRKIWQETHKTVIYVTHDIREALLLSQRIVIMSPQPGCVKEIVGVHLPAERSDETKDTEEFVQLQSRIRRAIHAEQSMRGRVETDSPDLEAERRVLRRQLGLRRFSLWAQYASVLVFFIALWKAITWLFAIPAYLVPPPEDVFARYIAMAGGTLWTHTWATLSETVLGFLAGATLGFVAGYAVAKCRRAEQIMMPYVVAAQTVPKIAFAPLVVIWFGFGMSSKVILGMLVVFFPILINTVLGMRSISEDKRELMSSVKATWWQVFTKLELYSMLPELFAGFKTGITLAVIGAVVGEFVGAKVGLGYLTTYAAGYLDTSRVFATLLQLSLMGIVLYGIVSLLERWLLPWRTNGNHS